MCKAEKEDFSGAVDDYSASLDLFPNDPETYLQRGLTKILMNNKYDGCLDLKRAEELGSTDAKAAIKKSCK